MARGVQAMKDERVGAIDLWERWLAYWRGDLSLGSGVIAPGVVVHFVGGLVEAEDIHGPDDFTHWIGANHGLFRDLTFEIEAGPIYDGDAIASRWIMRGRYQGGIPGAPAAIGTEIAFTGTDILRHRAGRVVEYWLDADRLTMLQLLGVLPA